MEVDLGSTSKTARRSAGLAAQRKKGWACERGPAAAGVLT